MQVNTSLNETTSAERSRWERRFGIAAGIAIVTVLLAPRASQAVAAVLAALSVLLLAGKSGWRLRIPPAWPPLVLALGAIGLYLILNAALSVDRTEAYGKVLYFWVLLASGTLASAAIGALDSASLRPLGRGVLAGCAIASVLLLIEVVFDQPLKTALFKLVPAARIAPKHLQIEHGTVVGVGSYVLNRNVGILSLVLWPALLLIRSYLSGSALMAASAVFTAIAAATVFPSEHETSMLALIFSTVAFAGMLYVAPVMRALVLAGWLIATLLVIPLASLSYSAGLHQAKSIPQTGRNRIILWNVTAEEVKKRPLLGIGVASTKELDEQAAPTAKQPEGHSYPLRTGRHGHNIFVQTWYELGAVGAVLLALMGLLLLRWLAALPGSAAAYGHAAFVAAVMIGAFSWGMWQTWFMAAYAIWALTLVLAVEIYRRQFPA